jgi:hypothetical protein
MTVFNKKISILHFNTFFVKNHGLDRIRIGSGFSESLNPDRILQIHTGIQINTIKFFFVRFVFLSWSCLGKTKFDVEDYSFSQTTLEQVFIEFAKQQEMEDQEER